MPLTLSADDVVIVADRPERGAISQQLAIHVVRERFDIVMRWPHRAMTDAAATIPTG